MTPLQKNILAAVKRRPMTLRELQNNLQVDNSRLRTSVSAMVATGELAMKNGTYVPGFATYENPTAPGGSIPCTLVKLAARFGFASRDDGEGDIFIPGRALHGAMPNDKILVKLFDHPRVEGSSEGEVLEVTVPNNRFAGTVCLSEDGRLAVEPDGCRDVKFLLAKQGSEGVHLGDKVGFLITHRGERHNAHRAAVVEKFGSSDYAAECAKAILYGRNVRLEFPPEVLEEARAYDNATIDQAEAAHRMDLRAIPIFTIDSAETKDIDDAISLQKLENGGYELGVHIADVSHYVRPGSALDNEAYERATSIYYADKVIPMLPTQLSNGICSLNPQEDRLAFSALMRLDEDGGLVEYDFRKTVIRSRVKGVYSEINQILDGTAEEAIHKKYDGLEPILHQMKALADRLARRRSQRGSLDLESTEAKILIGEDGRVQDIVPRQSGVSEGMIEEFMLVANEAAASFGLARELPFLFRIHEDPSAEKLEALAELLKVLGLDTVRIKPGVQPSELQAVLKAVKGTDMQMLVNSQLLRSMAKARYSEVNKGHFGLVLQKYSHFTSPIRRYPDLAIHRIMSESLKGTAAQEMQRRFGRFVQDAAVHSSTAEQRAMSVERSCEDCYKAEYMSSHLGESYEGMVSGVIERGIFVELPNTVEGMIRISEMPGHFEYDGKIEVKDKDSGRRFRIGDRIRIKVARTDVSSGEIDFVLDETTLLAEQEN